MSKFALALAVLFISVIAQAESDDYVDCRLIESNSSIEAKDYTPIKSKDIQFLDSVRAYLVDNKISITGLKYVLELEVLPRTLEATLSIRDKATRVILGVNTLIYKHNPMDSKIANPRLRLNFVGGGSVDANCLMSKISKED